MTPIRRAPKALRISIFLLIPLIALAVAGMPSPGRADGAKKLVIFPFAFHEVPQPGTFVDHIHQKRLEAMTAQLRTAMDDSPKFDVVPIPAAPPPASTSGNHTMATTVSVPIAGCVTCELDAAKRAGADYAMIPEIQKVTAIAYIFTVATWDVANGKEIDDASAYVRGDTNDIWARGVDYLIKNHLLKSED